MIRRKSLQGNKEQDSSFPNLLEGKEFTPAEFQTFVNGVATGEETVLPPS